MDMSEEIITIRLVLIPGCPLASYPDLLTPAFVANMDCRMTDCSTSDSLGDVSWVQKDDLQLYRRNVPLLHMSRYVTACDQFYQAFPHVNTASNKHWVRRPGVRRPGYEASSPLSGCEK